ncbi:MAG: hypothetical protein ACU83V_12890 [Gammaproteobacteria bacterium]
MNETFFRINIIAAAIPGEYAAGYRMGLRRLYHGKNFGSVATHEKCMILSGDQQDLGDGYRAGYNGKRFISTDRPASSA